MSGNANRPSASDATADPLRDYEGLKFELASLVRATLAAGGTRRDGAFEAECQALLARLAEDQFNLVVVGQFSRGKTSLMNAVLGLDRLPTGILPLTSVITAVRYGSEERALVEYHDSGLRHEIALVDLPSYITQDGNPANRRRIRSVEVQLPVEVLRRGFRFVDTPGLGSSIAANTTTTEQFLPEADAVLFVTSCDSPLSQAEIEYLRLCSQLVHKTFLLVNKTDLLGAEERRKVTQFVRERIAEEGPADLPIYAVSARSGLRAKQDSDADSLEESGLAELERALIEFLTAEKSRALLAQNCDRLAHILESIDGPVRDILYRDLGHLRRQIHASVKRAPEHITEPHVVETRMRRTCTVCEAAVKSVADFMAKYQFEISHDRTRQAEHAQAHGFCPFHTWQYERLASPRGVSSAYPAVLYEISTALQQLSSTGNRDQLDAIRPSRQSCAACQVQSHSEHESLKNLSSSADGFSGLLCLRHLPAFITRLDGGVAQSVIERHVTALERIAEDMQRFAIKHEGRRRDLISNEENNAYYQGLALLVGDRRLSAPLDFDQRI